MEGRPAQQSTVELAQPSKLNPRLRVRTCPVMVHLTRLTARASRYPDVVISTSPSVMCGTDTGTSAACSLSQFFAMSFDASTPA